MASEERFCEWDGCPFEPIAHTGDGRPRLCQHHAEVYDDERASRDEHQRLADAASKFIETIYPDFVGDLPAALEAMAEAKREHEFQMFTQSDMEAVLRKVSRT